MEQTNGHQASCEVSFESHDFSKSRRMFESNGSQENQKKKTEENTSTTEQQNTGMINDDAKNSPENSTNENAVDNHTGGKNNENEHNNEGMNKENDEKENKIEEENGKKAESKEERKETISSQQDNDEKSAEEGKEKPIEAFLENDDGNNHEKQVKNNTDKKNDNKILFVEKDEKTGEYKWPELVLTPLPSVNATPLGRANSLMESFVQKAQNTKFSSWIKELTGGRGTTANVDFSKLNSNLQTMPSLIPDYKQLSRRTSTASRVKLPVIFLDGKSNSNSRLNSQNTVQHSRTSPTVQSVFDPIWMGRRAETSIHTHTIFDTKQFCSTPYGEGEVMKYKNDGTVDVKLQWGAVVSCDVKDIKTTRLISSPNLEKMKPILTPVVRKHHINMLYSRYKIKNGRATVLPLAKKEEPKTAKKEEKNDTKNRIEKFLSDVNERQLDILKKVDSNEKMNNNNNSNNEIHENNENEIMLKNLNFGERSYNTWEKLKNLEGSEKIPDVKKILTQNFLKDSPNHTAFPMPCFARPPEIRTIESCVYVDKVNDFKVLSESSGCRPFYSNPQNAPSTSNTLSYENSNKSFNANSFALNASGGGETRSTSRSYSAASAKSNTYSHIPNTYIDTTGLSTPSSLQYNKIATDEFVKAPGILHTRINSLSSATDRLMNDLSTYSRQLGWSADWKNAGNECTAKNMNFDEKSFHEWINNLNAQFHKNVVLNDPTYNQTINMNSSNISNTNNYMNNYIFNTLFKSQNQNLPAQKEDRKVAHVVREEISNIVYQ